MNTLIRNACLILPDRLIKDGYLIIKDGLIDDFGSGNYPKGAFESIIDAQGKYLSPGFIDTHVHGALRHDFTDADPQADLEILRNHFHGGTTTIMPTFTSVKHELYLRAFEALDLIIPAMKDMDDVPEFAGIHMEGPYCSGAALGAQNTTTYRNVDYNEVEQYLALAPYIRKWTAACELNGGMEFGKYLEKHGIVASIGHSNATLQQVFEAYECGYHHITHLYSACSSYHRNGAYREGGIVEAAWLIDDMDVEMITDGVHLPKEFLQLIYKIKGPDHICMITDATRYCGVDVPEGSFVPYRDGDCKAGVYIENGVAVVQNRSCFAGSISHTNRLVRTAVNVAGINIVDAVKMVTLTPARINGFDSTVGSIARGKKANLLVFDDDVNIKAMFLRGKQVM